MDSEIYLTTPIGDMTRFFRIRATSRYMGSPVDSRFYFEVRDWNGDWQPLYYMSALDDAPYVEMRFPGSAIFDIDVLVTRHLSVNSSRLTYDTDRLKIQSSSGTESIAVDATTTAGQTRLLVYDVDNATLERVTVGAADSGGVGYKLLRIPN